MGIEPQEPLARANIKSVGIRYNAVATTGHEESGCCAEAIIVFRRKQEVVTKSGLRRERKSRRHA